MEGKSKSNIRVQAYHDTHCALYLPIVTFIATIMSMGVLTTLKTTLMTQESPSKLWATVND